MEKQNCADFSAEEFEERYSRTRRLMAETGIDLLLISERLNYQYYSGHRSMQSPIDKIRPYVFLLPLEGEPVIIAPKFEYGQLEQATYFSMDRIYETEQLFGHAERITSLIKKLGCEKGVIGCEFGREQYLGLSYQVYSSIMKELPNVTFVDASSLLLQIRAIKSPVEIQYMKKACSITSDALTDTLRNIMAGMTEEYIARMLRARLFQLGAEYLTFLYVVSGTEKDAKGINPLPTKKVLKRGETFSYDVGISYKGYCSDIARTAVIGYASDGLKEFYLWNSYLKHSCEQEMRPNNKPAHVIDKCQAIMRERGIVKADTGRMGHGIGLDSTEYPSIAKFDDIYFEKGMTLACNPNFITEYGYINVEDNWVITKYGAELLSKEAGTNEIQIVG